MRPTLLFTATLLACASQPKVPPRPLGAHDHLAEAERHERDARAIEQRAGADERLGGRPAVTCGDQTIADQVTSGGERLGIHVPCWTDEAAAVARHRDAARLRADARAHRVQARALVATARIACEGLPESERDHSPFAHHEDIAAVEAVLEGDRIAGARITFHPVPGLDAAWLGRALACHHAQAAVFGFDPLFMTECPSAVAGATTTVLDEPAGLVVVVRATDPAAALVIYARAEALLAPHADTVSSVLPF